jgi:aerobic-type carbon monoxide dehydrogenase small subunit (CoxS/CutS family)
MRRLHGTGRWTGDTFLRHPVSSAVGKKVLTIEAIGGTPTGKEVQQAWLDLEVVQCG